MYVGGINLMHCNRLGFACLCCFSAEADLREKLSMSQQYVFAAMQVNHRSSCISNSTTCRQRKWLIILLSILRTHM